MGQFSGEQRCRKKNCAAEREEVIEHAELHALLVLQAAAQQQHQVIKNRDGDRDEHEAHRLGLQPVRQMTGQVDADRCGSRVRAVRGVHAVRPSVAKAPGRYNICVKGLRAGLLLRTQAIEFLRR